MSPQPPGAWRGAVALLLVLLLALLTGCAALTPAPDAAPAAEDPGRPVVRVEVDAPAPLKALLERHLDLARLARLTRGDAVTDTELARLVEAAPQQVRELLQTEGYFKPVLDVRRVGAPAPGEPETVRLRVDPGARVRVQRVTLEAEGALERDQAAGDERARATLAELRRAWPLPEGSGFRNADWSDAKSAALTRLRAAGYAAAAWSGTAAEVDRDAGTVRLFLVVDSGPLYRSGKVEIDGLERQDASTVQALAAIAPGTVLTESLLLDVQERLQGAGLFESVSVTLDPDPERAGAATVQVRLREQPVQVFTVGVGLSANTGPRASLEHVYRRVFGYAVSSTNKFELGQVRQAWTGEVSTHPGERASRWLLGGAIERLVSDDDVVLSQRLRAGRSQGTRLFEQLVFAEFERGLRQTDAGRTSTFALSGNVHGVLRRLDSALLPTDGFTLALQGGLGRSHGSASTSGWFGRAWGRVTVYRPLGSSWYGQARLEAGQVFLPGGVAAPDSQLFRAGGDDSVRGYGYRSLGPVTGGVVGSGPVVMTASVEVARPFVDNMPSLWGALFVDAGRAGNAFGTLHPAVGYGGGVRWRSPVGPLRLDLAWGQETRKFRLHFSVGIAF
ncbi:MAG: BamA/TamA family outer membrane protein [Rubrivivax sp.]